jgi:hypothetical protein
MEVNLRDLMDNSEITTEDLDYIIERLMNSRNGGVRCYELVVAFIEAYKRARTISDKSHGERPYYTNSANVAEHISGWCNSYINHLEDDSFP